MDSEYAKNELDYIKHYESKGYTVQFRIADDEMEDLESKMKYRPEDVMIIKEHRYEGISNPSDMSLLYVLETKDGRKGTILADYSAEGDTSIHEFMNLVPKRNVSSDTET